MKEKLLQVVNNKWFLSSATAVGGALIGYTLGYKRTKDQYDRIEEQIEVMEKNPYQLEFDFEAAGELVSEMRVISQNLRNSLNAETKAIMARHPSAAGATDYTVHSAPRLVPNEPVEDLEDKRSGHRSNNVTDIGAKRAGVVTSVFGDGAGDEWDYKAEIETRDKSAPYIIHVDEYMADEMGFDSQSTLTWYEGDQILCDSQDRIIYNYNEVVGELRFGHGSNDPNVVFIRNERLQAEYEVLRDSGSYQEIVLGETLEREAEAQELKHSATRKFRDD